MPALDTPIYCLGCGYDIRANDGRCSECGREFNRADPRTFLRRPRRRWTRWLWRAGYLLLAMVLFLGAAWGWLYWGWKQEQNALAQLRPAAVHAEGMGPSWVQHGLVRSGFVLDRARRLDLRGTQVTDAGLVHLQGLSRLRQLNLYSTRVTDAGLVHLKGLSGLKWINLGGTGVSDAGVVHLKGLSGLEYLCLRRTRVTDAGVAALRKAIPRCEIFP